MTEDGNGDAALARPIQFKQKNALPAAEVEATFDNVDALGRSEEKCSAMRKTIAAFIGSEISRANAEVIVTIIGVGRNQSLEEIVHVSQQQRLMLVDDDAGRGVPGLDVDKSAGDP